MAITSTSRPTRRAGLAVAALALSAAVTGCSSAGFDAQTLKPYQPAEGVNGTTGSVAVRNVLVVADEKGSGNLHAVLVNTGAEPERLASVTVDPSVQGVRVASAQPITLPAGQSVMLPGGQGRTIAVTGAKPGQMIKLTLTFGSAAPLTAQIPVITTDHFSPTARPTEGGH